jgi:hypothetical protein
MFLLKVTAKVMDPIFPRTLGASRTFIDGISMKIADSSKRSFLKKASRSPGPL